MKNVKRSIYILINGPDEAVWQSATSAIRAPIYIDYINGQYSEIYESYWQLVMDEINEH